MGQRISLAFRSTVYAIGFFLTLVWLIPSWLGIRAAHVAISESPWRMLGILPLSVGIAIAFWCVANFVVAGRGTPAPFDAPRHLVIKGPYRYVRNPMYVGGLLFLGGWAWLFADFSLTLLGYALGLIVALNLFIWLYEEPILRRKFNGDYKEFCLNVGRWIPRTQPWQPEQKQAATSGK